MISYALYSIKGGVGKTASTVNLAYLAANSGARTLICDLDPQSSTSFYLRVKPKIKKGKKTFIKGGSLLEKSIKGTDFENLDLLPADFSFRNLDISFDQDKRKKSTLKKIIAPFKNEYDYIFLDCPPNLTFVSENVFSAVDFLLSPMIPTTLSLRSFEKLLEFFAKNGYQRSRIITFFSLVEKRKNMHVSTMEYVLKHFQPVCQTAIGNLSDIEKMGVHRKPVLVSAPRSPASESYRKLWHEILTFTTSTTSF